MMNISKPTHMTMHDFVHIRHISNTKYTNSDLQLGFFVHEECAPDHPPTQSAGAAVP